MFTRRFALLAGTLLLLSVAVVGDQNTPTAICNDNRTPAGILARGVVQIPLEARQAVWYPNGSDAAHLVVAAFGEEGHAPKSPGLVVRVPMNVEVCATIRNSLDHTIYVHGLASRPEAGLQPQPPADPTMMADAAATLEIPVGAVREVRFKSGAPGSYYYLASNDRQHLLMR